MKYEAVYQCTANPKHKDFVFGAKRLPKYVKCSVCGKMSKRLK